MPLLLHICCGICATYPTHNLIKRGMNFHGLWFNPNISPDVERAKRLDAVHTLATAWGFPLTTAPDAPAPTPGKCTECYSVRLDFTARHARAMGFGAFTTTLLASPYQQHDLIASLGRSLAIEHGVEFHYEDFRSGWRQGRDIGRRLGLYSQYYCGCSQSKTDRDTERSKKRLSHAQ